MYRADIHVPMMPWKLIIMPTSLLTFFLVFYSRNCFKRYYDLYKHCMLMSARVAEFAALLRIHFPKADADGQHGLFNMCRYPLASVYLLYFSLSGGGSDGGKVVTESEWCVRRRRAAAYISLPHPSTPQHYTPRQLYSTPLLTHSLTLALTLWACAPMPFAHTTLTPH